MELENNGLVVSDGSMAHTGFRQFHRDNNIGPAAFDLTNDFTAHGKEFTCVSYLGEKYGPSLAWQFTGSSEGPEN